MGAAARSEIERKAAAVRSLLGQALERHGRLAYANSLGAEAMVLTDIIWSHLPQIDIFSIDTGRLHEETYELFERLREGDLRDDAGGGEESFSRTGRGVRADRDRLARARPRFARRRAGNSARNHHAVCFAGSP